MTKTTRTASRPWSKEGQALVRMVESLAPSDLPEAPWVLHFTPASVAEKTYYRGGPCVWITDNEVWLRSIMIDVSMGPDGPRARHGALQQDLRALTRVLVEGV